MKTPPASSGREIPEGDAMAGKKKREKNVDEFRKERTKEAQGHPRHFFKKKGKKYIGLGITHADRTNGRNNIPLKKNPEPNPKDKRPVYIRVEIEEVDENRLSARLIGWKFSGTDTEMVRELEKKLDEQRKEQEHRPKTSRKKRKK